MSFEFPAPLAEFVLSPFPLILLAIGFPWSLVIFNRRGELRVAERLMVSLLCGILSNLVTGLLLCALGSFNLTTVWIASAVSMTGGFVAAYFRGGLKTAWRARPRDLLGLRTFMALAVVIGVGAAHSWRLVEQPDYLASVVWIYLSDILSIVREGTIPSVAIDYGLEMDFETNKTAWYLNGAQWALMAGIVDKPWHMLNQHTVWVAAGAAFTAWVFFSRILRNPTAAVFITFATLALPKLVSKLSNLRGEAFGQFLLFACLWGIHMAVRRKALRWHVFVGIAVALIATSHMVPAVIAIFWYAALLTGTALRSPRSALRRLPRIALSAAVAAALTLGAWSAVHSTPTEGQSALGNPDTYKPYRGKDPTHAFVKVVFGYNPARHARPFRSATPREFYVAPGDLFKQLQRWSTNTIRFWPDHEEKLWLPFFMLLFVLLWRHERYRATALAVPVFFGIMFAWGMYFSYRYHTYLPAEHPNRREFCYLQVILLIWGGITLDRGFTWLRNRLRPRWLHHVVATLIVAALAIVPFEEGKVVLENSAGARNGPSVDGLRAMEWLRKNTPPDARIASDGTSDGLFEVLAQRHSVTEGRAPYFQPANLTRVIKILEGWRRYFADPERWQDYLLKQRVDYVVIGGRELSLRGYHRPLFTRYMAHMEQVARFGRIKVFKVTTSHSKARKGRGSNADEASPRDDGPDVEPVVPESEIDEP